MLDDVTTGAYESLHQRNESVVAWNPEKPYSWADPCTRLLSFNTMLPPWNDRDMRWAVNFAVDKDEIVRIAYEGSTTKARIFFPPYKGLEDYVQLLDAEGVFEEYPSSATIPTAPARRSRRRATGSTATASTVGRASRSGCRSTRRARVRRSPATPP